jgi:polar amino acid transport system permease protein
MLKATSILSILTVPELMRTTVRISDYTAKPLVFYSVSAVIYTMLCAALALSLSRIERRFLEKSRA